MADDISLTLMKQIDAVCDRFEEAWLAGERPIIEEYLAAEPELSQGSLFRGLLHVEVEYRFQKEEGVSAEEYVRRFPGRSELIGEVFRQSTAQISRVSTSGATPAVDPTITFSVRCDNGEIASPLNLEGPQKSATAFAPGVLLGNRYLLERELGRGGMGVVFIGRDHRLGRPVAVKVVLPSKTHQDERRLEVQQELFAEEARLGANLSHPAIASVFDYGFHRGSPYAVFEYVSGSMLRDMMRDRETMALEDVRLILGPLAQAMDFAHQLHVVHRDLKPENIRATEHGQYKILDLGLARRFDRDHFDWNFAGTPAYAAPEQASEEPSDGRADQYALAVIAYEMLTGRRPFQSGDPLRLLEMHRDCPPESPGKWRPDLPSTVCEAILKTLSKAPEDRFDRCEDFAVALGCQILSPSVTLPDVIMESNARLARSSISIAWSRRLRDAHLLLVQDGLWTLHRGQIERWPTQSMKAVSRLTLGRTLHLTVRARHGSTTKSWRFASVRECAAWHATLKDCIESRSVSTQRATNTRRPPVLLLSQRPNVRLQVLGHVESAGRGRRCVEQSLAIRSALIGADAVVDVQSERLYGPRRSEWRLTGKSVKAVDEESAIELAVRWSASAVSNAVSSILWFSAILLLFVVLSFGAPSLHLMGGSVFDGFPPLRWFFFELGNLLHNVCLPLFLCLLWPVLLCLALQWLKWPQLNRPTVLAMRVCAMAPILGRVGGMILVGDRPRDWYAMVITVAEVIILLLLAAWIIGLATELWEIHRRSRELFKRQPTTRMRGSVTFAALLLTVIYAVVILLAMGKTTYYRVQDSAGRPPNLVDLAIENGPLYDLTKRQWVDLLSSIDREDRLNALSRLAEFAERERRVGGQSNSQVVSAIAECLSDTDAAVRIAACKALMSFRGQAEEATAPLNQCLNDPDPAVRSAASRTLETLNRR